LKINLGEKYQPINQLSNRSYTRK
jgi:hypothetical protein